MMELFPILDPLLGVPVSWELALILHKSSRCRHIYVSPIRSLRVDIYYPMKYHF
jgi:Lhr-like helicase